MDTIDGFPMSRICYVGAGQVGALSAIVMARANPSLQVDVTDKNSAVIESWKSVRPYTSRFPLHEPGLRNLINTCPCNHPISSLQFNVLPCLCERQILPNLHFSTDVEGKIKTASVIFICVNTTGRQPSLDSRKMSMGLNIDDHFDVVRLIHRVCNGRQIIVNKSTVPMGTAFSMQRELTRRDPLAQAPLVYSNPEFLAEGTAIQDLVEPERVLIGWLPRPVVPENHDLHDQAVQSLIDLYAAWVPRHKIFTMDAFSSELAKIVCNATLAQRVTNINTIATICMAYGNPEVLANANNIVTMLGTDPRLGNNSLESGLGFGGPCLEKDIAYLVYLAQSLSLSDVVAYWQCVLDFNRNHIARITTQIFDKITCNIEQSDNTDQRLMIAIFGIGFKKDTPDIRGSIVVKMADFFVSRGIQVNVYDPRVPINTFGQYQALRHRLMFKKANAVEACKGASAVIMNLPSTIFPGPNLNWDALSHVMQQPKLLVCTGRDMSITKEFEYGYEIMRIA